MGAAKVEHVKYWIGAYSSPESGLHFAGHGALVQIAREHLELLAQNERLRAALCRIERWVGEFPATGKFWDTEKTRPTSYSAEYGSNGERDFMRQVARDALRGGAN